MTSTSTRIASRVAVATAALGAVAFFAAPGAGAQTGAIQGPDTGSLGSIATMFLPGANGAFGDFLGGSVGESGSVTNMLGSAQGSLGNSGSLENMQQTLVTGSSEGSVGSIGDMAGQVDPSQIGNAAQGSNTASGEGSTMLKGVSGGSITGVLDSASLGLQNVAGN